jgi:hypothetical protein
VEGEQGGGSSVTDLAKKGGFFVREYQCTGDLNLLLRFLWDPHRRSRPLFLVLPLASLEIPSRYFCGSHSSCSSFTPGFFGLGSGRLMGNAARS